MYIKIRQNLLVEEKIEKTKCYKRKRAEGLLDEILILNF